ncbi:MAG: hypothetical protein Q9220_001044 [cf. Caloplaca sp. 1 TL-2023]
MMSTSQTPAPILRVLRKEFELSLSLRRYLKSGNPYSSTSSAPHYRSKVSSLPFSHPQRTSSLPTTRCELRYPWTGVFHPHRSFSVSAPTSAVAVAQNPRRDEDGNEMLVDITDRASTRLQEIMAKDSNPSLVLRVRVESGGCHGFQYLMSLTNMSAISAEDDTLFEASNGSGAKVVMDEPSLELLKGSKVDFTMELIGSQFKMVGNPAATSSCGCGTSFDIKL